MKRDVEYKKEEPTPTPTTLIPTAHTRTPGHRHEGWELRRPLPERQERHENQGNTTKADTGTYTRAGARTATKGERNLAAQA